MRFVSSTYIADIDWRSLLRILVPIVSLYYINPDMDHMIQVETIFANSSTWGSFSRNKGVVRNESVSIKTSHRINADLFPFFAFKRPPPFIVLFFSGCKCDSIVCIQKSYSSSAEYSGHTRWMEMQLKSTAWSLSRKFCIVYTTPLISYLDS